MRLIPLFKVSVYLILHTRLDYLATKLHEHLDVYYVNSMKYAISEKLPINSLAQCL